MKSLKLNPYFFILGLLSSIYLPFVKIGDTNFYGNTILSVILLSLLLFKKIYIDKYVVLIVLMMSCVLMSSLYSNAVGITTYTYRNYIEMVKYAQFLPYLIISKYINFKNYYKKANLCLLVITYFFILIFVIEYFNVFNLRKSLLEIYLGTNSAHFITALLGKRFTITGSDPNQGGAIALFLLFYQLVYFNFNRNMKSLILALILVFIVFSTQSRTVFIAMLVCGLITIIFSNNLKMINKILIVSIVGSIIYLLFNFLEIEYIKLGFQMFMEGDNHSVNVRVNNSETGLNLFLKSPIFGVGPAKNELSTVIDSEYVLILQRYGIMGVIVFSTFIMIMLYTGFKDRKTTFGLILFIYTLITLILMTTNNAYSGYQLMSISIFLIISLSLSKKSY